MAKAALLAKPPVSERMRAIKRILWIILFLNLGVAAAKYIYGTLSGSAAMQADGIHSVFDSAGNVIGLIGIALASRPADESHPYGHAKFETYASLAIGILLLLAAFEVGSSAVVKLVSQNYTAEVTPVSFVVMIVTLCVNLGVTFYERRQGKLLRSEVLSADASHTLSDALVSVGVIVGLVFVALGFPAADPIVALVVTVAILATAYDVFKHALATLSDHARIPEDELERFVLNIPGVDGTHRIRTRGTEGEVYVDLHICVDEGMTVRAAHDLSERIEDAIKLNYPQVIEVLVHIEPDDGHVD
ncbi:cation diffusion facilitator family transporter [Raoultibacter phocaeensis]|uniref:cation diffusion facilitator family transporter n=1 Tax=Raoultibacter phocaeensis TaxID=2479841 RepID=UPI001119A0B7|nr:cation diffusion facilitator family transporter [Raoultibacter phocaeensis]